MSARHTLEFGRDGAQLFERVFSAAGLARIEEQIAKLPADRPGVRVQADLLSGLEAISAIAATKIGSRARPVRAVLFDKSAATNWNLGWHQDRTIVVRQRRDVAGFGPWSIKGGLQHVEPPFEIIEAMATARLHLDPVDADNAPLKVAPGSHRLGRVPVGEIEGEVARLGAADCLAERGDAWLYATPILHASAPAVVPRRRRVLQIDFSAHDLPGGLEWLGL
jgi:ectoine hydroxylase-related dioxygenase (phytanoyl-CoA dioxygenase family)